MKKTFYRIWLLINFISFIILCSTSFVISLTTIFFVIVFFAITYCTYYLLKDMKESDIYELIGITYLQKKFKNSEFIKSLTEE